MYLVLGYRTAVRLVSTRSGPLWRHDLERWLYSSFCAVDRGYFPGLCQTLRRNPPVVQNLFQPVQILDEFDLLGIRCVPITDSENV